jgi:hypothetical protein
MSKEKGIHTMEEAVALNFVRNTKIMKIDE